MPRGKSQFRRLFINLMRNSIQANANKIIITLTSDNNLFKLLVSDNGNGIPEIIRDKIFESNFTTKEKGMGLGLKLAKRFMEGINGSIILKENSGNGAVFEITIPESLRSIGKNKWPRLLHIKKMLLIIKSIFP